MAKMLKIGIASYEAMKARTMAIARGQLKPGPDDPTVWFPSMESFARLLSAQNQSLLTLIAEHEPQSLTELATLSGRAKSNLSRTLRTLERYGLVHLEPGRHRKIAPRLTYSRLELVLPLTAS